MNLTELLTEVYAITNRADLSAESTAAVKAATLKAHTLDFFPKDLVELQVTASVEDYVQQLDYITLVSNFRAIHYLRKVDTATATATTMYEIIAPLNVLDSYGVDRLDVCYIAGRNLNVRSATPVRSFLLGCYVFPIVTTAAYSSWIADQFSYAIIYEAVRAVLKLIGDAEQSAAYGRMAAEEYELLMRTAITNVGY